MRKELSACELCPRRCRANRLAGERGICGADGRLVVARAALHHWEEPPVSGSGGSGTVFFSNCSLRCVYCQNESISAGRVGRAVSVARLAEMFLELEGQGAHNINLVTPTHYALHIIEAVLHAREAGLAVPVIYNTSGYELPAAIARLDGVVDVYLSDFKYASPKLAGRYSDAPDYPEAALAALRAMVAQAGEYRLGRDGMV
ncbi:MAG: radical SAM protein, partial [Eggerthellaceae bacterium]|nr:radical SAM protein [Eggerthellaceae bacterium]